MSAAEDFDATAAAARAMGDDAPSESASMATDSPDQPSPQSSGSSGLSIRDALTATDPDVSPAEASGTLDLGASWYQHAEVFLAKVTGQSGTPAWVNGLMAALAFAKEQTDAADDGDGGDGQAALDAGTDEYHDPAGDA